MNFSLTVNSQLKCLQLSRFSPFINHIECVPDVTIQIYIVCNNDLFDNLPTFFRSLLNLFPITPNSLSDSSEDCLVLRSPKLREDLIRCVKHSEMVVLELREFSAVVTNYIDHRVDHHCASTVIDTLSIARIGPSFFSSFLHDFDSLMIHSSCVAFNGKTAVFLAMDDGGKTTAASLCHGGRVLSDDQNVFRKQIDGSWMVYGTPWTTFPPDPGSSVPASFFLLEKSEEFSLQKLGPLELLSFLWDEHSSSRYMVPKVYQTKIFDLFKDLATSAPVYLMKFPKDYIDQEAILECLKT